MQQRKKWTAAVVLALATALAGCSGLTPTDGAGQSASRMNVAAHVLIARYCAERNEALRAVLKAGLAAKGLALPVDACRTINAAQAVRNAAVEQAAADGGGDDVRR